MAWGPRRLLHLNTFLLCDASDGKAPPVRRRTKLSPGDRIRDILQVSHEKDKDSDKVNQEQELFTPLPVDEASHVKKAPLPWKFGRRRSLSPMSRVQYMMEDQGGTGGKDSIKEEDKK